MNILIEEKDVSLVTLSLELEQAAVEHVLQDNRIIYVTSQDVAFPFWLDVAEGSRLICLSTYLDFLSEVETIERLEFCNRVNSTVFLPAGRERKGRFYADYAFSYRDGLLRTQFVRLCRFYADSVARIVREFDPNHEILKPVGAANNA